MLLKQKFKTHDGAHKRARFENAHRRPGTSWRYAVVLWEPILIYLN